MAEFVPKLWTFDKSLNCCILATRSFRLGKIYKLCVLLVYLADCSAQVPPDSSRAHSGKHGETQLIKGALCISKEAYRKDESGALNALGNLFVTHPVTTELIQDVKIMPVNIKNHP